MTGGTLPLLTPARDLAPRHEYARQQPRVRISPSRPRWMMSVGYLDAGFREGALFSESELSVAGSWSIALPELGSQMRQTFRHPIHGRSRSKERESSSMSHKNAETFVSLLLRS
jgi:hypothetical protein